MNNLLLRQLLTLATLLGGLWLSAAVPVPPAQPNIIVILVDDMGWSDIGCYGSEIPTPNLDALAQNGLRFTQFYNAGRCCPTRASLLTGLYPHQAGVGHMVEDKGLPGYQGRLNERCVTLAEVLRPAGYFTAMAGKWHVGQNLGVVPWERGFERSLNAPAGGFYYHDSVRTELFLNGLNIGRGGTNGVPREWYATDLWTDYGLKFIDEARAASKPFFLYLAHNAPHFPLQAPPEDIAKFRHGIYTNGWDKLREERYARQKQMGLIDPAWAMSERPPEIKPWGEVSAKDKERFDHIMSIYAACVWHLDKSIGVLTAALRQRGVLDNTLLLFMSDNGGNAESGSNGRLEGAQPGAADSMVYCGQSWAMLENTPFRRYKHFNHEGGIATPLLVHWPVGVGKDAEKGDAETRRGRLVQEPGHLVDIMATLVDVTGATYPKEFKGHPIQPMEGRSLVPLFSAASRPASPRPLYWEHEGNAAVRVGDWKLVRKGGRGAWELYDLKADRTELHDLAAAQPAKTQELAATWDAWARRAQVIPGPRQFSGGGEAANTNAATPGGATTPPAKKKRGNSQAQPPQ
jgi:arylsulfatase